MHHLLWASRTALLGAHHIHLCDACPNCTFDGPDGERCQFDDCNCLSDEGCDICDPEGMEARRRP